MNRIIPFCIFLLIIFSQSAFAQQEKEILVFDIDEDIPLNAKNIGTVKIAPSMRSNCGYPLLVGQAKEKAVNMGADIMKITEITPPGLVRSCYRITAQVYKCEDLSPVYRQLDSIKNIFIPPGSKYALVNIYRRPEYGMEHYQPDTSRPFLPDFGQNYKIHIDGFIYPSQVNTAYTIKIEKEGELEIWAKTSKRKSVKLDVKFGNIYYLECDVATNAIGLIPDFRVQNFKEGYSGFSKTLPGLLQPKPEKIAEEE